MTSDDYKAGLKPKLPAGWKCVSHKVNSTLHTEWQKVAFRELGGAVLWHHFKTGMYHVRYPDPRFSYKNWVQRSRQFPTPEAALSFYELTRG